MKRYRNGRYKSKRDYEIECKTRNYTIMITFLIVTAFSIAFHPWTGTYHNIHIDTKTANAQEIVQEEIEPASTEPVTPVYSDKVQRAIDAISNAQGKEVTDETKKRGQYLYDKSVENNVPFFDAVKTIHCESGWIAQKSHLPEDSFGLCQIHLPSHKNISQEQAMDAYFSIDFLIDNWYTEQSVKGSTWYGYSRSSGKCRNGVKIEL
jgi:hypothetical protein